MLSVGIVGAGGMGNAHARQYAKMADVQTSFFDIDEAKSAAYGERFGMPRASGLRELIAKSDIVDICLPTRLHAETALAVIAAGKAVFVEKPLARTLEEATQVLLAAEKAEVPVMTGQVVRFFPEFATGNRLVKEGAIGRPAAARTRRGGSTPTGAATWFLNHVESGGVLLDLAVHDFDWLRWTLGEVKHLYARNVGAETDQGPDYALTTLTFESGAVGHVETTWMDPSGFRTAFEVSGSEGMIQFDSRDNQAVRTQKDGSVAFDNNLAPKDDPYHLELRSFVDSVSTGSAPLVSAHDGWMALSLSLAAIESAKTGKVVVPARA